MTPDGLPDIGSRERSEVTRGVGLRSPTVVGLRSPTCVGLRSPTSSQTRGEPRVGGKGFKATREWAAALGTEC